MHHFQNIPRLPTVLALACLLRSFPAFAATPVLTLDFTRSTGKTVMSSEGTFSLALQEGATVVPDGFAPGAPALVLSGGASPVKVDHAALSKDFPGDELSFSMWIRPDSFITNAPIAFGYSIANHVPPDEAKLSWRLPTVPTELGRYDAWSCFEGDFQTGTWHHVAFRYSVSNATISTWLDGIPQRNEKIYEGEPSPIADILGAPFCENFRGALAAIRLWKGPVGDDDLLAFRPSAPWVDATKDAFEKAATSSPHGPFAAWCRSISAQVTSLAARPKSPSVRDWMRGQALRAKLPGLSALAKELAKGQGTSRSPFLPITVAPYSEHKRLPWKLPEDGRAADGVRMAAARGESEAASLVLFPLGDLADFHVVPTTLTNGKGKTIAPSCIDVRAVVVWIAPSMNWNSAWLSDRSRSFGTHIPELLVHDDALVRVDSETRSNWLRLSYRSGAKYVDVSKRPYDGKSAPFDPTIEPVVDAKSFQPMALKDGRCRQLWITVRIPEEAAEGLYRGRLDFTAGGKGAGSLPLEVEVRPYRLPKARTRYNLDLPYYGAWMNHMDLGGASYTNAVLRYRAMVRNLHEHNMDYPHLNSPNHSDRDPLPEIQYRIAMEEGLARRPLFIDSAAIDGEWCNVDQNNHYKSNLPDEDPEDFARCMAAYTNSFGRAISNIVSVVGHPDVFLYGWDEAPAHFVFRELPFFATARHFGARPYVTAGPANAAFGMSANDGGGYSRSHSRGWHEAGCLIWTYGCPFGGPENPALWRRMKGVRLYMANGDGIFEYIWYEGGHIWNDFVSGSNWKNFNMVYPTLDGCLDTMAWESLREGFDDVRYLTLLRLLAREAIRTERRELVRLGKRAIAWAERIDPELVELDAMRAEADRWIRTLLEELEKAGVETKDLREGEVDR